LRFIQSSYKGGERVYTNMDFWTKIRLDVLRDGVSKREILRREGIHWDTLKKILTASLNELQRWATPGNTPR